MNAVVKRPDDRVAAIDLARGSAILGMVGAHVLGSTPLSWDPATWYGLFDGRTTILFFLLAGLSTGLITGGAKRSATVDLVRARLGLASRAACVFAVGLALQGASVVGPFLQVHATLFVLAQLFLLLSARRLVVAAVVVAIVVPQLVQSVPFTFAWGQPETMNTLLSALVMLAPFLVGLALARAGDWSALAGRRLLLVGLGSAVLGYGASGMVLAFTADGGDAHRFLDASGHTGTTFELLGATGTGLLVLGAWLQLPPRALRFAAPLAALGSMPLTIVVVHALLTDLVSPLLPPDGRWFWLIGQAGLLIATASCWRRFIGQGPIERLIGYVTRAIVGAASQDRSHEVARTL
jgi:hypothetical protein